MFRVPNVIDHRGDQISACVALLPWYVGIHGSDLYEQMMAAATAPGFYRAARKVSQHLSFSFNSSIRAPFNFQTAGVRH
jgi:hypothetical protein